MDVGLSPERLLYHRRERERQGEERRRGERGGEKREEGERIVNINVKCHLYH